MASPWRPKAQADFGGRSPYLRRMRLLLPIVLLAAGCAQYPSAQDVCAKIATAGIGAYFDLVHVPGKGGGVMSFDSKDDYDATVKAFGAAAMLAGPHRYGNEKALIFVQANDKMSNDEGAKLKAIVDGRRPDTSRATRWRRSRPRRCGPALSVAIKGRRFNSRRRAAPGGPCSWSCCSAASRSAGWASSSKRRGDRALAVERSWASQGRRAQEKSPLPGEGERACGARRHQTFRLTPRQRSTLAERVSVAIKVGAPSAGEASGAQATCSTCVEVPSSAGRVTCSELPAPHLGDLVG